MSLKKISRRPALVAVLAAAGIVAGACSSSTDSTSTASTAAPVTTTATTAPMPGTVVDVAAANPDFSTLVTAVKAAGLAETLSGSGPFTVFAPTNAAFAKLPAETLQTLLKPESKQDLTAILTYHVVPARLMAADVTPGSVDTVSGAAFTVATDGGVTITDAQGNKAKVVKTDIAASNGVIHVIDTVLLPSAA